MDINKLTRGEQIIGVAAIVFIITTFLPWFTASVEFLGESESTSVNGWDVGFLWGRLPALLALVMLILVILDKLTDIELPSSPVPWVQIQLGLGIVAALLVILKLLIGEDGGASEAEMAFLDELGVEISRAWGLFLAVIAAIALAVGAFLNFNEHKDGASTTPPAEF